MSQTGSGHFSPIGGYHAEKDMALILDVARFKYPPHWVPLTLLWEAMDNVDGTTGQHRGYVYSYLLLSFKLSSLLFPLNMVIHLVKYVNESSILLSMKHGN